MEVCIIVLSIIIIASHVNHDAYTVHSSQLTTTPAFSVYTYELSFQVYVPYKMPMSYRIVRKFGGEKTWRIYSFQAFGRKKLVNK